MELKQDNFAVVDITRSIPLFIGSEKECKAYKRKNYNEY